MKCHVDGCEREALYKSERVCQKHYFRRMRTGSYELQDRPRKYRIVNPAGYQKILIPEHPLANSDGYVYEHRYVYFNEVSNAPSECEVCGTSINWRNCHIDHKNTDVSDNRPENLRAVCRPCNVFRGHTADSMGKVIITINGKSMSAEAWSRIAGVQVSGTTIRRRKAAGMSDYDAVYAQKITHNSKPRIVNPKKYDDERGVSA